MIDVENENITGEYQGEIRISLEESEDNKLFYTAFTDFGDDVGMLQIGIEELGYSIDGLYVDPGYRRAGIGSALLDTFLDSIADDMTMPCSMTFTDEEGKYGLIDFFLSRNDFAVIDAGMSYRLKIREFLKNKSISSAISKRFSKNIRTLGQLEGRELRKLLEDLKKLELAKVRTVNELKRYYDPDFSSVCIVDGRIEAAILAVRYSDTEVLVDEMYANGKNIAALETIVKTVKAVMDADPDMDISVFTISRTARDIMDKLVSTAEDVERSRTYIANWLMIPNRDIDDLLQMDTDDDDL